MPTEPDAFWKAARDWSQRKHMILDYYLRPAVAKLRRASNDRRVFILDGFAGRGEYEDGTAGSPVLIGKLADEVASWKNPVDLRIYNIEPDSESFEELERCTVRWRERGIVRNLYGAFQEHLCAVLEEADRSPLIAFLDPFRPSELDFHAFQPLLSRPLTELIVVFHTEPAKRMLGAVRPTANTSSEGRTALRQTLNRIFGDSCWERLLQLDSIDPGAIVECFVETLRRTDGTRRVVYHPLLERYGGRLKYHIVFVTGHADGLRLMNDAFCKERRAVYERTGLGQQLSLWPSEKPPVEQSPKERLLLLQRHLVEIGRSDPTKRWERGELIFRSIETKFGEFFECEHREAVTALFEKSSGPRFRPVNAPRTRYGRWRTNSKTEVEFVENGS